jgi:hypothetical protein
VLDANISHFENPQREAEIQAVLNCALELEVIAHADEVMKAKAQRDRLLAQQTPESTVWIGLDWIGLDWIGLDWIGLDWIGLDWIALD